MSVYDDPETIFIGSIDDIKKLEQEELENNNHYALIEAHIKPVLGGFKLTVLIDDNGSIKAYQKEYLEVNNYNIKHCMYFGSKLKFKEAEKLFNDIDKNNFDEY